MAFAAPRAERAPQEDSDFPPVSVAGRQISAAGKVELAHRLFASDAKSRNLTLGLIVEEELTRLRSTVLSRALFAGEMFRDGESHDDKLAIAQAKAGVKMMDARASRAFDELKGIIEQISDEGVRGELSKNLSLFMQGVEYVKAHD